MGSKFTVEFDEELFSSFLKEADDDTYLLSNIDQLFALGKFPEDIIIKNLKYLSFKTISHENVRSQKIFEEYLFIKNFDQAYINLIKKYGFWNEQLENLLKVNQL